MLITFEKDKKRGEKKKNSLHKNSLFDCLSNNTLKNDIRYEMSDPKTTNKTKTLFSCEKNKGEERKKTEKRSEQFSV